MTGFVRLGLIERSAEIDRLAERASIISYVRSDAPPMLIFHGTEDFPSHASVEKFADAMRAAGAEDVTLVSFRGDNHGAFLRHLVLTGPATGAFLHRTLGR